MSDREDGVRTPDYAVRGVYDVFPEAETQDYGLALLQAPTAWKESRGAGITVGILDTGCDQAHPDLSANVLDSECSDGVGHGTHVAGIIAAAANGQGVVGVAPDAKLRVYCCVPGSWDDVARALRAALADRVSVVTMSLGTPNPPSPEVADLLEELYQAGVVLIAAAGNTRVAGQDTITYPARCVRVIPVAAIDATGKGAPFSATGSELERGFCMPGVDVLSTWPGGRYAKLSGTSMAAPFLAGLVALLLSRSLQEPGAEPIPAAGPARVEAVLERLKAAAVACGDAQSFGYGYIDATRL